MEFHYIVLPWILLNSKRNAIYEGGGGREGEGHVYLAEVLSRLDSMRMVIKNEGEATDLVGQASH